jgi:hypothetical protein
VIVEREGGVDEPGHAAGRCRCPRCGVIYGPPVLAGVVPARTASALRKTVYLLSWPGVACGRAGQESSIVVAAAANRVPNGSEQGQERSHDYQDDPECPQNRNPEQIPSYQQNNAKNNHDYLRDSVWASADPAYPDLYAGVADRFLTKGIPSEDLGKHAGSALPITHVRAERGVTVSWLKIRGGSEVSG